MDSRQSQKGGWVEVGKGKTVKIKDFVAEICADRVQSVCCSSYDRRCCQPAEKYRAIISPTSAPQRKPTIYRLPQRSLAFCPPPPLTRMTEIRTKRFVFDFYTSTNLRVSTCSSTYGASYCELLSRLIQPLCLDGNFSPNIFMFVF